jgi:branched-chain amino acid transport system permease protein
MKSGLALQLFLDGMVNGSLFALMGVSWSIVYGTTRVFHFAHVLTVVLAAYAAVISVDDLHLPVAVAAIIAVLVAAVAGAAAEGLLYRRMRRVGTGELGMFLVSMGLFVAGVNIVQIVLGAKNRSFRLIGDVTYHVGSATITKLGMWFGIASVLIIGGVALSERRSRWGRSTAAVRTNVSLASALGVKVERVYVMAFVVGSVLAGVCALYVASTNPVNPTLGLNVVVSGLIAMFLGGAGNTLGAAVGGFILGLAQSMGGLWLPGQWQPTIALAILLVILLVRPKGLFTEAAT